MMFIGKYQCRHKHALANSLLINGVPFAGEYETVAGTTIYLKNGGGYGTLILNVIASDTETMENQDVVSRKLVLHMEQGVTGILVGSTYAINRSARYSTGNNTGGTRLYFSDDSND